MNIDLTITEEKKIVREIELPYYAQDICYFLMIAKNETIVRFMQGGFSLGDEIEILPPGSVCYQNALVQAINGNKIYESDFIDRFNNINQRLFAVVDSREEILMAVKSMA